MLVLERVLRLWILQYKYEMIVFKLQNSKNQQGIKMKTSIFHSTKTIMRTTHRIFKINFNSHSKTNYKKCLILIKINHLQEEVAALNIM